MIIDIAIIKLFCLVISIWYTQVNLIRGFRGSNVSARNFVVQALAIAIFLGIQFNMF
jgi:hypothetical protein